MNILILGNSSDAHATHLWNSLTQAGATVDYLDTRLFPTKLQVAWRPDIPEGTLSLPSRQLNLHEVHSVFWRSLSSVYVPLLGDANQQKIAFNDAMSTLRSLLKACSARWVNSWEAYEFHQENLSN